MRPGSDAEAAPEPLPPLPSSFMPLLLFGLVGLGLVRPKLLKRLFGHVD